VWNRFAICLSFILSIGLLACSGPYAGNSGLSPIVEPDRYDVYHQASGDLATNIVLIGDGYVHEDNEPDGKWHVKSRELADAFLEAPVIRDFKENFSVYIYYADSEKPGPGVGISTPFRPGDSGAGPRYHPNRAVMNEKIKAIEGIGDGPFNVMYISNKPSGQWEAEVYGQEAWGYNNSNRQWVIHEFIGHNLCALVDEYAGAAAGEWGDVNYRNYGTPFGVNVSRHGFPASGPNQDASKLTSSYTLNDVNFPDVPGGPMAWADEIFGDKKGDGFFALDRYEKRYFNKNPKWALALNPNLEWPQPYEGKSSAWPDTDWRHFPPWVVFIGRTGYTKAQYDGYAGYTKLSQWINGLGGANHSYQADDACCMRQDGGGNNSNRFCANCRYRIWVEIQHRAFGKSFDGFYMDLPAPYQQKFPSKAGLKEFVPYDKAANYGEPLR
jgi:hypothetical protein